MNADSVIKVENLSKVFPLHQSQTDESGNKYIEHWVLKDVSFEIKKGEIVGIIGPNGSGKSTLLKILAGVIKPTSGNVKIKGKIASILDIGAGFHPELNGRDNIFLNGQIHGFSKREVESKFDEIVKFSGVEKFINEPVKNYSNGMYLRLAFSIMVHLNFDIYMLDEVLGVGDEEFRKRIDKAICQLLSVNKSIIFVSHNNVEIANFSDRLIKIDKGLLEEIDNNTFQDIKYRNRYYIGQKSITDNFAFKEVTIKETRNRSLDSSSEILLKVQFTEVQAPFMFGISFNLSGYGNIFEVSNYKDVDKGDNSYTLTFPEHFLSNGVYHVDLFTFDNNQVLFLKKDIISIQIESTASKYKRWGVVRPSFSWIRN